MPAARPSKSAVATVLAAMREAGLVPGIVRVMPDGGFEVAEHKQVDESEPRPGNLPRKWGQTG